MKLGIMQPYFFPYLGYFDLIHRTDRWVVFDVVKYASRSWMNRNRILHPTRGWQYVTVPVDRHAEDGRIMDVRVLDPDGARRRLLGQLDHYRQRRAPYFAAVAELVGACFRDLPSNRLRDLCVRSLAVTCAYLGVAFRPELLSALALPLPPITHAGQWALEIASALGAREYVNPPGGRDLFDPAAFARRGITLTLTEPVDFTYACRPYQFVGRLSVLDVLMWAPPAAVKAHLDGLRAAA